MTRSGFDTNSRATRDVVPWRIGNQKNKLETVSFRFGRDLRVSLQGEAIAHGVSLNALASQILNRHVSWYKFAEELGLIPLNREIVREVFEALNQKTVIEIAERMGNSVAHEEIRSIFKEVSSQTIRRYIEVRSAPFPYQHWYDNGRDYFMLRHDLGSNFSIFVKEFLSSLLKSVDVQMVNFLSITPSSISFILSPKVKIPT